MMVDDPNKRMTAADEQPFGTARGEEMGVEAELPDESLRIEDPFDPAQIRVTTERKNIDLIVRRIDHGEVDLAPEFQRRARVWHAQRKSQLIESLLLRIPLPVFYVSADATDNWAVVDGLHRLTTIYDFVKGGFYLTGLEYLSSVEGFTFERLDRSMRRRIEETELVINVIQPGTPEAVMINIFKRINTGGVPLTGQEIRNALNKGPVREFLRRLAASDAFRIATDYSVKDDRMDAQEMVLRFLAFRLTAPNEYRTNDLDTFLNETMRRLNGMDTKERENLEEQFSRAMYAAHRIFDNTAFRKPRLAADGSIRSGRNPVSKPLFETWSSALATLSDEQLAAAIERKSILKESLARAIAADPEFVISISYSTGVPARVAKRFGTVSRLLAEAMNHGQPALF